MTNSDIRAICVVSSEVNSTFKQMENDKMASRVASFTEGQILSINSDDYATCVVHTKQLFTSVLVKVNTHHYSSTSLN